MTHAQPRVRRSPFRAAARGGTILLPLLLSLSVPAASAREAAPAFPPTVIRSMALPLGSYPKNAALAVTGSWGGERYRFGGVFLVGANPAPSSVLAPVRSKGI